MENALSSAASRLAGVAALFVALGAFLSAESNDLSRHQEGAIAFGFGVAMLALHVLVRRRRAAAAASPDASLAALVAVLTVPSGLIALLWDSGIGNSTTFIFFRVSRDGIGNGLLLAAAVFAVAYVLARDARWLVVVPLSLVGGIEAHLVGSGDISSGGGSWTRFLLLVAASAGLVALAARSAPAERHNLLLASALIVPFAFVSYPPGGASIVRDIVGAALLAGLTLVTWRRISPGIGFATLLMATFEVASLSEHGRSLAPSVLFAIAGVVLLLAGGLLPSRVPTPPAAESP
jgi:hypothetical protein